MTRHALLLFAMTSAGCSDAAWGQVEVRAPPVARAERTHWEQYCTFHGTRDLGEVNVWLHQQGQQGWELVAKERGVYCFKTRIADASP